jgi:hypothetical protein
MLYCYYCSTLADAYQEVHRIGLSNTYDAVLVEHVWEKAKIKPTIL